MPGAEVTSEHHDVLAIGGGVSGLAARLAPTRARLIEKGLLNTPGYGLAAFTVPQFDRSLLRSYAADGDGRASR